MYVSPRHPDGLTLATRASDRLRGPRRTAWGTWCWSDPTAPRLELFGPPPAMPPPSDPPPVDDVVHRAEVLGVMPLPSGELYVRPDLADDPRMKMVAGLYEQTADAIRAEHARGGGNP